MLIITCCLIMIGKCMGIVTTIERHKNMIDKLILGQWNRGRTALRIQFSIQVASLCAQLRQYAEHIESASNTCEQNCPKIFALLQKSIPFHPFASAYVQFLMEFNKWMPGIRLLDVFYVLLRHLNNEWIEVHHRKRRVCAERYKQKMESEKRHVVDFIIAFCNLARYWLPFE